MAPRFQTGRKLSQTERLRQNYQDKREIRDKLIAGADEDGEFSGTLTDADLQRLGKLVNESVRKR